MVLLSLRLRSGLCASCKPGLTPEAEANCDCFVSNGLDSKYQVGGVPRQDHETVCEFSVCFDILSLLTLELPCFEV